MVSIKRNLGLFFIKSLVFVSFMGLCCAAYAVNCSGRQRPCCKGKTLSCCPHPGYKNGKELSYDISECMEVAPIDPDKPIIVGPVKPIEKECTSGQTQYQPKGDCGTSSRSCCSGGTWSDWDGECSGASSCGANECWNGSKCVSKPSSTACTCNNGTCSLTYRCVSGSGWKSTKNCTCDSGYQKNSSGECVHSSCVQSCSSGKYRVEISSGLRAGQCDCCSAAGRQKKADGTCGPIATYYDCLSGNYYRPQSQTCCRKIDELVITMVYTLPSTYSSCSNWGRDMGWSMESTECCRSGTSL